MRVYCYFCSKSVSTEMPKDTIIRALLVCPECIEAGKISIEENDLGKYSITKGPLNQDPWPEDL